MDGLDDLLDRKPGRRRKEPEVPTDLLAHPAAELFPMMGEAKLAELAADIKANGLLDPIILDAEGKSIVDGRNRYAACQIAGVAPRFDRLNGEDPEQVSISRNGKRRDLTAAQRACAAAIAWKRAEDDGRVRKSEEGRPTKEVAYSKQLILNPRDHFAARFGAGQSFTQQAKYLFDNDPLGFEAARNGADFKTTYQEAIDRRAGKDREVVAMERLRVEAPDLADLVGENRLSLDAAELEVRKRRERIELLIGAAKSAVKTIEQLRIIDIETGAQYGAMPATREHVAILREATDRLETILDQWEAQQDA
jgi:hypothetical protein